MIPAHWEYNLHGLRRLGLGNGRLVLHNRLRVGHPRDLHLLVGLRRQLATECPHGPIVYIRCGLARRRTRALGEQTAKSARIDVRKSRDICTAREKRGRSEPITARALRYLSRNGKHQAVRIIVQRLHRYQDSKREIRTHRGSCHRPKACPSP